jgi:HEAT repeat protein
VTTGAYLKEHNWYYDLARTWDGRFVYLGSPVGEEEHGKYTNWDSTGSYLLSYALPLKSLYLTGKKPSVVPELNARETADVIAAGREFSRETAKTAYDSRSTEQLMSGITSWSPAVRKRSAQALGRRQGDFVPQLLAMLSGSNRDARYGACEALGCLGTRADSAAPKLRELLTDPDPWMQSLAALSLPSLGDEVRKASVSDLLKMTANPSPNDPRRMAQRAACAALFSAYPGSHEPRSILAQSLDGIDRDLLYPAIKSALENEDSVVRGSLDRVYGKLTDRDLVELLPAIVKATYKLAPSNEMFGDGVRLAGLDLLSRLHIREGIPLCIIVIETDRWGAEGRMNRCLEYLKRYGAHAQIVLPQLQKMLDEVSKPGRRGKIDEKVEPLQKAIAAISAATEKPTLVDVKNFSQRPEPPPKTKKK